MLHLVATVPLTFQRFPINPGNSTRHARDMDAGPNKGAIAMTATSTRRAILAGAVTLPALSLPAFAGGPDPVFAAIEEARAAWARYGGVLIAHDPDWNNQICVDAHNAWADAREAALKTMPTTPDGLAALIAYALERDA
jgi:hypothetical protein